jgi:hypothetical protein
MSSLRLLRLQSDYEAVRRLVHLHPRIKIDGVLGNPPELYRLFLSVHSLQQRWEQVTPVSKHRLEIRLPQGYPRNAPVCRMLTPVFHPNIAPHVVCIGEHWTAAESLDRLIMRVCEMLAFQSYNTKSPLNGDAAQWVDEHPEHLPIDKEVLFFDLDQLPILVEDQKTCCSNCSRADVPLEQCLVGHLFCDWCSMDCEQCKSVKLCLKCELTRCIRCSSSVANA